jgi:hypothetical protein
LACSCADFLGHFSSRCEMSISGWPSIMACGVCREPPVARSGGNPGRRSAKSAAAIGWLHRWLWRSLTGDGALASLSSLISGTRWRAQGTCGTRCGMNRASCCGWRLW